MSYASATALNLAMLLLSSLTATVGDKEPDKTIEITRKDGKLVFTEKGKDKVQAVSIVVGETIRWVNRDELSHTLKSVAKVEGEPLFDTGAIRPGKSKDVRFDIDIYRNAGGRTANFVRLKYVGDDRADEAAELIFLSAARR